MKHGKTVQTAATRGCGFALAVVMAVTPVTAFAAPYDEQIKALNAQVQQQQAAQSALSKKGDTLANKVAALNAQANALQAQLDLNRAKSAQLTQQIAENEANLVAKKAVLNENIRAIYQQSSLTPIEMLASSKNFSEYVDKQQYYDKIKSHIQDTMEEMARLKVALEKQKVDVNALIANQANLASQVVAQKSEAARLLSETRGEEAAYAQQVGANRARIEQLQAAQAAALRSTFGGSVSSNAQCGGGYPYCNVGFPSYEADPWGMYKRQCVSYTAFRVANSGRNMPYWGGRGNAKQWPGNAMSAGIPTSYGSGAQRGDVAITTVGEYGHAMYVESVNGGMVTVSQYNYGNDGRYSEMTIPQSGLYFIHF